jgi:hypothetical protein
MSKAKNSPALRKDLINSHFYNKTAPEVFNSIKNQDQRNILKPKNIESPQSPQLINSMKIPIISSTKNSAVINPFKPSSPESLKIERSRLFSFKRLENMQNINKNERMFNEGFNDIERIDLKSPFKSISEIISKAEGKCFEKFGSSLISDEEIFLPRSPKFFDNAFYEYFRGLSEENQMDCFEVDLDEEEKKFCQAKDMNENYPLDQRLSKPFFSQDPLITKSLLPFETKKPIFR